MKIVIGLGNPGSKYITTRHNIGFLVIDKLLQHLSIDVDSYSRKFLSLVYKHEDCLLCKPETFMNLSGEAARAIKTFYKLQNSDFLIIYDDLYLPEGTCRISVNRNSGGHNGIKDLISKLGGNDFLTLRVGIGPRERADSIADYVLQNLSSSERTSLENLFPKLIQVIEAFLSGENVASLQNKFN